LSAASPLSSGPPTCVIHLVWAPLGTRPLTDFLESYRRHDAGSSHRLLILLNGFRGDQDLAPWRELLADVDHDELRLERPQLDIAAYQAAVAAVPAARYCFLNSYSEVMAGGWLAMLESALDAPGVGLVGASGSWGSIRSYQRFTLGFGGPYANVFDDRRRVEATLAGVAEGSAGRDAAGGGHAPLRYLRALLEQSHGFLPFPAEHVRTNGFMIGREVLERLRVPAPRRKSDAYRLESGREGITAKVQRLGLAARVVACDGRAYDPPEWYASATFWQRSQESLLIADNQTRAYERADSTTRAALASYAWGELAQVESELPVSNPRQHEAM
jgi:hypothetical protein